MFLVYNTIKSLIGINYLTKEGDLNETFRKLIKFLFIIILIGASICCIIGYSTYNQAVKEKHY